MQKTLECGREREKRLRKSGFFAVVILASWLRHNGVLTMPPLDSHLPRREKR